MGGGGRNEERKKRGCKEEDKEKIGWKNGRRGRKEEQSCQVSFIIISIIPNCITA